MKTNLEIEFKTAIDEKTYKKMINKFNLENSILKQTNHYFDTENEDLINQKIVLRIRQKGDQYKLTSKTHTPEGALERHLYLTKDEALDMLENGFDASIINIGYNVEKSKFA